VVKWPVHEAEHSPPTIAEDKITWICTAIPNLSLWHSD
jgi:hypothetical protein